MRTLIALLLPVIALVFAASKPPKPAGPLKGGAGVIDLDELPNYAAQPVPAYILRDNTPSANAFTDAGATLGRVLFYDKQLSVDGTIACASCHRQEFAFSDTALASAGVAGTTGRHAMRLVNARFAEEFRFFWDERANSLEMQTTMPVRDHGEMGFSGTLGDPDFDSLITRLSGISYYPVLFTAAFGDATITEVRMQDAIAQFVRSIQSFDSRYDVGRAMVGADGPPFPNFTGQENAGKQLFLAPPVFNAAGMRIGGGAGCQGCHRAPEFDIDPASLNNGVIGSLAGGIDLTNTRAPSLRDAVNASGAANGPFFHNGLAPGLGGVIAHYDNMPLTSVNPQLDPRLTPGGNLQRLQLTPQEINELVAFLRTLTGSNIYSDVKWSDPFLNGALQVIGGPAGLPQMETMAGIGLYPTLTDGTLFLELPVGIRGEMYLIVNMSGGVVQSGSAVSPLDVSSLAPGPYVLRIGKVAARFIRQ